MAYSFYSNSQQIDFDSVLAMDDQGMESMFQALMASGLAGFLGYTAVIYEAALVDFFENASVREGVIISTVTGKLVEISEEWFAESFDLPVDGLGDLSEIPKDVIFDARSIVSLSGEPHGTQLVTTGLDVVDVQRVVRESHQELNARINSLDEQVAATRHDLLEFSAQAQQTMNIITSQLSELVAYINRGGDNKKGESSCSRRPLPTPVHQSEGTGDAVRITEPTQADIDNANRAILERMRNEDRERERRERSRGSRSGSYKRRRF
ncbi:hypothetical protein F511_27213 [Dorcoceras hygrometricum]|uniref:Dystroglycan-like n=1 Tax=Dorcoceras hygrometricum TaxID=472368 RepID=A0A2Z7BP20_9LAMI|nr:hypothetical protein F511_27213 [Dorcoceras hygrometricum]